jgi:long-chain acyl-CoA synthetase
MNLYSLFLKNYSEDKKLIFNDDEINYKEFKDLVDVIANNINKKYNKIAILSGNQKIISLFLFACAKESKTLVTLNKNLKTHQINTQLKISEPDIIVVDSDVNLKELNYCNKKFYVDNFLKPSNKNKNIYKKSFFSKNFIITFSSGTTSLPKPILYTQKIKYLRFLQIRGIFNIKKNDTIFSVSSIDHSLGQRLLFLALLNGSNFIYFSKYNFKEVKKLCSEHKISFTILPSNYLNLLKKYLANKSIFIPKIVSAASTLITSEKYSLIRSGITLYEMYGASEIGTVTSINFNKKKKLISSVGKVLKNIKIKIVDDQNKCLKIGEVGEIICKTPLKFKGYYRSDNLTKKSLNNGYFKTGDLGKMDKNNYLYFVSRKQDVIISSGKNIYPIDIEKELLKLSYLKESAIIGIKDKFFGEIVFAVCVLKKKINNAEDKIRKYLSKRVGGFQQPLGYDFVKQLPRNNLGKIQKNILREIYNKQKIDLTRNLRRILN